MQEGYLLFNAVVVMDTKYMLPVRYPSSFRNHPICLRYLGDPRARYEADPPR